MLLWGVEEELCDLTFRKFPPIHEVPPETKRVNTDDLTKMLSVAAEDLADIIRFGILTGLRPQELRELCIQQVIKPESNIWYIRIEQHKTAGRTNSRFARAVPLGHQSRAIIERQMAKHPNSTHIFLNNDSKPYTHGVLRNRMIRCCKKAGVKNITPYALRHSFASLESDCGVETTALARLMGHSNVQTLSRYASNSSDHDLRAVHAVESALGEALKAPTDSGGEKDYKVKKGEKIYPQSTPSPKAILDDMRKHPVKIGRSDWI